MIVLFMTVLKVFLAQVPFFEKIEVGSSLNFKGIKGRLAKHVNFLD